MLLQVHRRMTSRELAERLETSERTVHRDMAALSTAGIPITAARGSGGGWELVGGYKTQLTGLTEAEIRALFIAGPTSVLKDLGLGKAAEAAFIKLFAALPAMQRGDAEFVKQRIYIDVAGWKGSRESTTHLGALQDAIWRGRQISMRYQRSDEQTVIRQVSPLGLVAQKSAWYLVAAVEPAVEPAADPAVQPTKQPPAASESPIEMRTFRVSRIQALEVLEVEAVRPGNFDLAAYWEQSKLEFRAALPKYPARLRVRVHTVPHLYSWSWTRVQHVGEPDAEGWCEVDADFEVVEEACARMISAGDAAVVLEPQALKDRLLEIAKGVLARYG